MSRFNSWITYLQVAPLALVFLLFLVVPIVTIVVVSFFDYNTTQIIPAFVLLMVLVVVLTAFSRLISRGTR